MIAGHALQFSDEGTMMAEILHVGIFRRVNLESIASDTQQLEQNNQEC